LAIVALLALSTIAPAPIQDFKVDFYAEYTSPAGDRILDIVYIVKNGSIATCQGTYSYPPSSEQELAGDYQSNIEPCRLDKLLNHEYNVPLMLFTSVFRGQKMSGEFDDGEAMYRYRILVDK
jgi:hypothetical protein